ncbi:homeobox-leucine zipper protein HOX27-like [Phragmites australis]|uniref:homeobox-leucine zipper protein HOX27-like n=1 Tax=Phragmites australis TaxID=29695 RepID=UPI002D77560E|nr:homeobox-leucine zipper protein HOX27-like [Phragmites australis]
MDLGLSLGEAPAVADPGRAAPELGLGLGVGVGAGAGRREEDGRGSSVAGAGAGAGAGARWWEAASPEPAVRLSLVSGLGIQWLPSGSGRSEASARGFDVNRAPSVAAASASALEEDEEDPAAAALSSSPNDSAGLFSLDRGRRVPAEAPAQAGIERSSSRASDEDEGASARKKLRLSKEQSAFLEENFKEHSTLNPKQKAALAKELNLRPRQVEVWFQNRRARTKLKQTEVDCEYLKRCCDTLTEENRRLHKEIAELRALKTVQPFYLHLPATTLSMCPSCERIASNPATSSSAPTSSAPPAKATTTNTAVAAPAREHRPSSFAALFAATRSFQLTSSQPRPPAPASNCL